LDAVTDQPSRRDLAREAVIASVGILLVLTVVKHAGALIPVIGAYAFTAAAAIQLYVPLMLIGKRGITKASLGLSLDKWRADLAAVAVLAVVTAVPFAIGHHYWQTVLMHHPFKPRLPDGVLEAVVTQVLVVALAEELYFRGYLQERLQRIWPAKRKLFGVPFGMAIVVAAAVFALAHFLGEYQLDRLGPFFPALVFGLLRARTGTIVGSIAYHAFCNVLGEVLWASYKG
jgi:membrane protease YdiL (CAAX protease family)